ncbi:MAG: DUF4143 domain-containing protein [Acidobacteria bacterium]|nr:DUF4143 domain-containing protein [Acidobacteriota bacterium]
MRRLLGYARYDSHTAMKTINDLYANERRLFSQSVFAIGEVGAKNTRRSRTHVRTAADPLNPTQLPRLLELSAEFAGQLINLPDLGRTLGLDHKTVGHLRILEQLYLLQRLQPWSRKELSRLVKTPTANSVLRKDPSGGAISDTAGLI